MTETPLPHATPPRPKSSLSRRAVRFAAQLFLCLLALPLLHIAWTYLSRPDPGSAELPARLALALGILSGPCWLGVRLLRHSAKTWRPALACVASLLLLGVWLARDDQTLRHDPDHPALRSDFPGAASTHAMVLRHSKGVPGSRYDSLSASDPTAAWPTFDTSPEFPARWTDFVSTHRVEIETHWEKAEPLRAWFDELSGRAALADLTETFSDPTPGFAPLRHMARVACAQATLLALDGHGDDALAVLGTVLDVGQKLQTHSRTLVRRMIAVVIQRQAIQTANLVLSRASASPVALARFAEILTSAQEPAEGAALLARSEYFIQAREFAAADPSASVILGGQIPKILRPLFRLGYRPRATINHLGDACDTVSDRLGRRDLDGLEKALQELIDHHAGMTPRKNHAGHLMVAMALPAYAKVGRSYWELQDWRAELRERLATR